MSQPALPLSISPAPRRRGRPPGSANKRSLDLARWIEASFGGLTPGQQAAELALVRPRDIAKAKAKAKELLIVDVDLPAFTLAMVVKAKELSRALGCTSTEAWVLMQKERSDLMAYVHQKQPQAAEKKAGAAGAVFVMSDADLADTGQLAEMADDDERIDFIEHSPQPADQVGQPKSDDAP